MIKKCYRISDKAGIHMRPATQLANACAPFVSSVTLHAHGQEYDAKEAMALLLARIEYGACVGMCFVGADEYEVQQAVERAMLGGFFAPCRATLEGMTLVPGVALAPAMRLISACASPDTYAFAGEQAEYGAFQEAVALVAEDCLRVSEQARLSGAEEQADIYAAHAALAREASFARSVYDFIREEKLNAATAVAKTLDALIAQFEAAGGSIIAQRTADLRDIRRRLIDVLNGQSTVKIAQEDVILVGHEVLPGDIAAQDPQRIKGIVTNVGGATSHVAIIARSLGIPMVLCSQELTEVISDGQMLAIITEKQEVLVNPDAEQIAAVHKRLEVCAKQSRELQKYANMSVRTRNGMSIQIYCNVESARSVETVRRNGAEGVGLFRTEYVFMNRQSAPTEEEQFLEYKAVAEAFEGDVVIRTLDVGADKMIPYLQFPQGENPLLGTRGIRFSFANPDVFMPQLRALLRASAFGRVKIMFPFVSAIEEMRTGRAMVEQAKQELRREGIAFNEKVPVGMMVELPSVAVLADRFAKEADFFSIGTNDLLQYTFAMERCADAADRLPQANHPAMLRLIHGAAVAANRAGIELSICGAAAESELLLPVWIAMGVDKLSVGSAKLLDLKRRVASMDLSGWETWLAEILACATADEVSHILETVLLQTAIKEWAL